MFELTVYGTPQPAGSKRALPIGGKAGGRPIIVDASSKSRPWKEAIAREAGSAMKGTPLFRGPLYAYFTFYRRRPKSHLSSKGEPKLTAPQHPTTKPDALKLARAVEDALTGLVYADDAQIVVEHIVKRYGEPERVEIAISEAT